MHHSQRVTCSWCSGSKRLTADAPAKQALVAWNATAGAMYTGDAGFTEASGNSPTGHKVPNSRTITNMEMYDTGAENGRR